jgi:hypothetical protein
MERTQEEQKTKDRMSIDKILFACVSSYLLGMMLWISWNEQLWGEKTRSPGEKRQSSAENAQFIDYMRRSLLVIDGQGKQSPSAQTSQLSPPLQPLSPTVVTANPLNPNPLKNDYVTIAPKGALPVIATAQKPTPVIPPPPPLVTTPVPPPSPLPQAVLKPSLPVKSPTSVTPPPPPLPREKPETVPTLGQNSLAQLPNSGQSASNFGYSLVGLMESGDQSAALFDINGITQRISLGESIGNSGWSLLSVSNQQAVVAKGAETRSIYVGNKF